MTAYDDLALDPSLIATVVAETVYTGNEISVRMRSQRLIDSVETRRKSMTPADRNAFAGYVDARCRAAYTAKATWFIKCVRARDNKGRDHLYTWVAHWLAFYCMSQTKGA
jgi:hypothetical protein